MGSVKEVEVEVDGPDGVQSVTQPIWVWTDYMNFLLGTIDGAMGALPQQSYTYYCNKNSTAARLSLA
jgi:hypothetical protein